MRRRVSLTCVLVIILTQPMAAAALPSVEAFGRVPRLSSVSISPDGKSIAWQATGTADAMVVVFDFEAGKDKLRIPVAAGNKLRDIRWADDATLLMTLSVTHTIRGDSNWTEEFYRTLAVDIKTAKSNVLLLRDDATQYVTGARLLAGRTSQPYTVTMATWDYMSSAQTEEIGTRLAGKRKDSGWVFNAFSVDTRTGRGVMAAAGTQFTDDWAVDAGGQPIARSEWEPAKQRYTILAKDGLAWRTIHAQENVGKLRLLGASADASTVLALGGAGKQTAKLWSIPLDGSGAQILVEDPERDVVSVLEDAFTAGPIGVTFGGAQSEIRWLDRQTEAKQRSLARAFPDRRVEIVGRSENFQRVIARVDSPSHPPVFYVVDFVSGRADIVGESYPELTAVTLGKVRAINYKARDGAPIPAYVTLPPGATEENLPLVVLPHGGPESNDKFEFHWWAQFLASRGYAVLQPQFRGSTGFGEAHRLAGYRQWGRLMQDDVTDGVQALIEQGLADPRRVCIVGASYGGYAALAGAAFTPEIYACAASINGVSDLPAMIGHVEKESGSESDDASYWRDHIGAKLDPRIAEKSPARAAAAVKAPVLLVHGVDDTVVPIAQSERMKGALEASGKPFKFVKLPGEDHWLSGSATRTMVLAELEVFLADHLAASDAR